MDKEERELQIKLAKLQTDVQIWLAISLTFLGAIGGFLIGGYQLYITSVPSNLLVFKNSAYGVLGGLIVFFGILARYGIGKMEKYTDSAKNDRFKQPKKPSLTERFKRWLNGEKYKQPTKEEQEAQEREAEAQERESRADSREDSEGDALMTLDPPDLLFPSEE